jgi:hypothetical protein
MTYEQRQAAQGQLPDGAKITKTYTAFENGELRLAVQLPNGRETRYIVHFEGEDIRLEHRP